MRAVLYLFAPKSIGAGPGRQASRGIARFSFEVMCSSEVSVDKTEQSCPRYLCYRLGRVVNRYRQGADGSGIIFGLTAHSRRDHLEVDACISAFHASDARSEDSPEIEVHIVPAPNRQPVVEPGVRGRSAWECNFRPTGSE